MSTLCSSARSVSVPPPNARNAVGWASFGMSNQRSNSSRTDEPRSTFGGLTLDQHRVFARVACAAVGRHEHLVARVEERGGAGGVRHRNAEPHELALGGPVGVAADHRGHPGRQAHRARTACRRTSSAARQRCLAVAHRAGRQVVGRRARRAGHGAHAASSTTSAASRQAIARAVGGRRADATLSTLPEGELTGLRPNSANRARQWHCPSGLAAAEDRRAGEERPAQRRPLAPHLGRGPPATRARPGRPARSRRRPASRTRSPSVRWCST